MLPPRRLTRRETGKLRTWENDGGRSNLYVLFGVMLGWLLLAVPLCRASNVGFHLKMEVCDDNGNYTDCYNVIKGEVELDSQATTASLAAWSPPVKLPDDSLANVKIQDPAGRGFSLYFEKEPVMFENPITESPVGSFGLPLRAHTHTHTLHPFPGQGRQALRMHHCRLPGCRPKVA
eukprot:GHVU01148209.1.p1 GENE.GHVU01148209.1~~GHVU01148209.1.p1  ORF type:complete len:177 (+),score=5.25 GHVU01148209.1:336-866(+)